MSFFTQTPRFTNSTGILRDGVLFNDPIIQPSSSIVGPGAYKTDEHDTISGRISPKYNHQSVLSNSDGMIQSPSKYSPQKSPVTGTFGQSLRSSPLSRSYLKSSVLFHGTKSTSHRPKSIGPGSYTDAHFRGSDDVVASLMVKRSFNVKAGGAKEGSDERYKHPGVKTPPRPKSAGGSPMSSSRNAMKNSSPGVGGSSPNSPYNNEGFSDTPDMTTNTPYATNTYNQTTNDDHIPSVMNSPVQVPVNDLGVVSRPHKKDLFEAKAEILKVKAKGIAISN